MLKQRKEQIAMPIAAIEAGMKSLKEGAMEEILLGMTTLEESLRVIYAG